MPLFGWHYVEGVSAWGEMTGTTARFCEMDCYLTPWIVEFINTTTNLLYIFLGIFGYLQTRKSTKDPAILFCHALHVVVGFGSIAYHLNVKYVSQMADEIAMFLLTNTLLYSAFTINAANSQSQATTTKQNNTLKIVLTTFTAVICAGHCKIGLKEPFEAVFITLVILVVSRCAWVLINRVTDPVIKKEMTRLVWGSSPLFVVAIAIQKLDFVFCAQLTALRERIGYPLGFLTELHGWWHILTAISVYNSIVYVEYLRAYINEQNSSNVTRSQRVRLDWTSRWNLARLKVGHAKTK